MEFIKSINQILAFLLEMVMFFIVGYWGYVQGKSTISKYSFAIILPLIAIVLWGFFAAPKSNYRLETPARLIFELGMFFAASFLLYKSSHTSLAILFISLAIFSEGLAYILKQ